MLKELILSLIQASPFAIAISSAQFIQTLSYLVKSRFWDETGTGSELDRS